MKSKIYLSPSGQIHNAYADGKHTEAEVCRKIASKCAEYLSDAGCAVKVANPYNNDAEWKKRCDESDNMDADYHIPIHTNAGGGHGVRIFTSGKNKNDKVVKAIYNNIMNILPSAFKKGSMSVVTNLYEINKPKAKTIYIEVAFHDNMSEATWIVNNIDNIGKAIAEGVLGYKIAYTTGKNNKLYRVQVGAYSNKNNAIRMAEELKKKGYQTIIKEG